MQLKEGISYKVNLKHLLICLFIELIVVVITNLILFKIDKSYENKIILFYLHGQLQIGPVLRTSRFAATWSS